VLRSSLGIVPYNGPVHQTGIVNSSDHIPTNNETIKPLIDLIAHISEADIVDRSAGDGLSKVIAMVQVIWFVVQLIGRRAVNVTITELEIATVAYATMNLVIYIFWWSKPLRVDQQIILYSLRVQDADPTPSHAPKLETSAFELS
jgi:hypothetical protein